MFSGVKQTRQVFVIILCGVVSMVLYYGLAATYLSDNVPQGYSQRRNIPYEPLSKNSSGDPISIIEKDSHNFTRSDNHSHNRTIERGLTEEQQDLDLKEYEARHASKNSSKNESDVNKVDKTNGAIQTGNELIVTNVSTTLPYRSGFESDEDNHDGISTGDTNERLNEVLNTTPFFKLNITSLTETERIPIASETDFVSPNKEDNFQTTQRLDLLKGGSETPVYLCVNAMGRLGNLMFEVAAMLGTARRNGVKPAIPRRTNLDSIFEIPYTKLNESVYWNFEKYRESKPCTYEPVVADFTVNLTMKGYYQSWRYFEHAFPEVRKSFTFLKNIRTLARDNLMTSILAQHINISLQNLTFVGIHVRRGDMMRGHFHEYGYKIGSVEYLLKAMSYFIERFSRVMFVVCSNDMEWTKKVIPFTNATFSYNQLPEVDLALLSQCNHTIMTVGSFGWWAGWLAGGITVYQRQQYREGTGLSKVFTITDYMLPDWIPIDEN